MPCTLPEPTARGPWPRSRLRSLQAAGIRVGLYTSPHLLDFCERIRVRGTCIPEDRVVDLFDRIQSLPSFAVPPTFFEVATAMAFQYFAEERVDIAVLEVGLGGRFDATNVCRPVGTVITKRVIRS